MELACLGRLEAHLGRLGPCLESLDGLGFAGMGWDGLDRRVGSTIWVDEFGPRILDPITHQLGRRAASTR